MVLNNNNNNNFAEYILVIFFLDESVGFDDNILLYIEIKEKFLMSEMRDWYHNQKYV